MKLETRIIAPLRISVFELNPREIAILEKLDDGLHMLIKCLDRLAFDTLDACPKLVELRVDLFTANLELFALLKSRFEILDIIRHSSRE